MVSHLLFAGPDQKDDEDREHYGSQSHDNEWKVGHQRDDHQQLLNFRRGRIVNHHTLLKDNARGGKFYYAVAETFMRKTKSLFERFLPH